jgi:hypothetical protein
VIDIVTDSYWWLPPGVTWEHLDAARNKGLLLPQLSDFKEIGMYCVAFAILRWSLENIIFKFLGRAMISHRPALLRKQVPHKQVLLTYESADKGRVSDEQIAKLSSETRVSAKKISAWIAEVKEADLLMRDLSKWTETCWRLTFLTFLSVFQYWNVWDKSWMWNPLEQWENHPFQSIDQPVRTLYLMEIAVYLNLMVSQFTDVRRKDFWAMFIHHIATIILIGYSYTVNFVRNGILVLMCHDPCDVFMEAAKLFKYAGVQAGADFLFVVFMFSWGFLRLYVLPFHVVASWLNIPTPVFPSWYFMTGLLGVLQILHVYWFFLIARIAWNKVVHDKEVDDEREEEMITDVQDAQNKGGKAN